MASKNVQPHLNQEERDMVREIDQAIADLEKAPILSREEFRKSPLKNDFLAQAYDLSMEDLAYQYGIVKEPEKAMEPWKMAAVAAGVIVLGTGAVLGARAISKRTVIVDPKDKALVRDAMRADPVAFQAANDEMKARLTEIVTPKHADNVVPLRYAGNE